MPVMVVSCSCPTVPDEVRSRSSGSVQPEVPLLSEQSAQRCTAVLLHCKSSVCWCTRVRIHARVRTVTQPLQVEVTEKNPDGYLSATEMQLSRLYIGMAAVFFTAAMIWVYTLMKHRYSIDHGFGILWSLVASPCSSGCNRLCSGGRLS